MTIPAVAVAVALACNDDDDDLPPPVDVVDPDLPDAMTVGLVQVVHAAPGAPAVDVFVLGETEPAVTNLAFGQLSPRIALPPGEARLEIRPAGTPADEPAIFTSPPVEFEAGTRSTVVAAGDIEADDPGEAFRLLVIEEDDVDEPAEGTARARVVNAGWDPRPLAVDVEADGTAEATDIERFGETGAEGVELPATEEVQLGLLANDEPLTFTLPQLEDRSDVILIATGDRAVSPREQRGFSVLLVGPDGEVQWIRQNPVIHVLHAVPDANAVDIFANDVEVIDSIEFGVLERLQVVPGALGLDVFAAVPGENDRPAADPIGSFVTEQDLQAGGQYLLVATGQADASTFQIVEYEDAFALNDEIDEENQVALIDAAVNDAAVNDVAQVARIRAIHSSPDAPAVAIGTVENDELDAVLVEELEFPDATEPAGLEVEPGTVTLGLAAAGTESPLIVRFPNVTIEEGDRKFLVVAGKATPAAGDQPLQLLAIETSESPWTIEDVAATLPVTVID